MMQPSWFAGPTLWCTLVRALHGPHLLWLACHGYLFRKTACGPISQCAERETGTVLHRKLPSRDADWGLSVEQLLGLKQGVHTEDNRFMVFRHPLVLRHFWLSLRDLLSNGIYVINLGYLFGFQSPQFMYKSEIFIQFLRHYMFRPLLLAIIR
jgi:hypothetical protein